MHCPVSIAMLMGSVQQAPLTSALYGYSRHSKCTGEHYLVHLVQQRRERHLVEKLCPFKAWLHYAALSLLHPAGSPCAVEHGC
jgi:hypothetical protein